MHRVPIHRAGANKRRSGIVSHLLLVLLAANLCHSYVHGCGLSRSEIWWGRSNAVLKPSAEGSEPTYSKIPPCLACSCQKQNRAVLSSQTSLAKPRQIGSCLTDPQRIFKKQPYLPLDLSRPPPLLGYRKTSQDHY